MAIMIGLTTALVVGLTSGVVRSGRIGPLLLGVVGLATGLLATVAAVLVWYQFRRDRWERSNLRVLSPPALPELAAKSPPGLIPELLKEACDEVATTLGIDSSLVRANVFAMSDDGKLRIVPGLTWNMNWAPEFELPIMPGDGAIGASFETNKPYVTAPGEARWSLAKTTGHEQLIHPDLQWVVAVPVGPDGKPSFVMGVDGLVERPDLKRLEACVPGLVYWAFALWLVLENSGRLEDKVKSRS